MCNRVNDFFFSERETEQNTDDYQLVSLFWTQCWATAWKMRQLRFAYEQLAVRSWTAQKSKKSKLGAFIEDIRKILDFWTKEG